MKHGKPATRLYTLYYVVLFSQGNPELYLLAKKTLGEEQADE